MSSSLAPQAQFTCTVRTEYLSEQSDPAQSVYAHAYTITIQNTGPVAAQLVARHWVITDAAGHVEEVRGLGVVGNQPFLQPGQAFEYTSWTQLRTPAGHMRGTYFCVTEDAVFFETAVPEFVLAVKSALH